jgi:hypothetical protein
MPVLQQLSNRQKPQPARFSVMPNPTSYPHDYAMSQIIFGLVCVAGVLLVGYVATRLNQRIFPQRPKTTYRKAGITSVAILSGLVIGFLVIPESLIPENQYTRVILAVGLTILLGSIELNVLKRLSVKWLNEYLLDGDVFPFVSFGFSCSLLLKPYLI